jgi:CheY-like chemotaxis protein
MTTILLADDSILLRAANAAILTRAGYKVLTAGDGEEALQVVRQHRPDLVILDLMMPKLGGEQVLQALRKDAMTKYIPVIVLTSLYQKNEQRLRQAGASVFIEKSRLLDKPQGLVDTVVQVLKSRTDGGTALWQ